LVIAEIELPDFRTTLLNCSSDSLSRLRRTLTCTLSLKSNELRKYVGLCLFMGFSRDDGLARPRPGGRYAAPAAMVTVPLLAKILSPSSQHPLKSGVPSFLEISPVSQKGWLHSSPLRAMNDKTRTEHNRSALGQIAADPLVVARLWIAGRAYRPMPTRRGRRWYARGFSAGKARSHSRKLTTSGQSAVPSGATSQSPRPDRSSIRSQR